VPSGLGVDASGGAVVDPTANVIALVEARADAAASLREADLKFADSQAEHLKEIGELRAVHAKEIRELDTIRLEKVREVDQLSYRTETERAQTAIRALADSQAQATETLRKTMEGNAALLASQQDVKFAESNKRISALELALSEGKGKQTVADPAMERLAGVVEKLAAANNTRTGFDAGRAAAIAGAGVLGGGGIAALVMQLMRH
jgi:hypothetical protein